MFEIVHMDWRKIINETKNVLSEYFKSFCYTKKHVKKHK